MTLLEVLPLIRGWSWRRIEVTQTVLLNQELLVYQAPTPTKEIGWVVAIDFAGNDAYLGVRIVMPGFDVGYTTFAGFYATGSVLPPPSGGCITRYWQPNPLRTLGAYFMSLITSAYAYPFYGAVRVYLSLRTGSTEPSATGIVSAGEVIVEDRDLFLKDLRKVYFGRLAPLMDLLDHVPILRMFTRRFDELGIKFEEKEVVEPPGYAR